LIRPRSIECASMKKISLLILIITCTLASFANHITGGKMYYKYLGKNSNGDCRYRVTLNLYRDCFSNGAPLDEDAAIGIFRTVNRTMVSSFTQHISNIETLEITDPDPCITNPPLVCYQVGYYEFDVSLPETTDGYTITYQRCCRIAGINNLQSSSNVGATYTAIIPGTSTLPTAPENNSAQFIGVDKVIVCANNPFTYSFAATDDDSDILTYSFCNAYLGGGPNRGTDLNQATPNPPAAPPYQSTPYGGGFNATAPLGPNIKIDANTGLITGIAPGEGIYCITVCATEYRNGIAIATQRKDLQIKIADCSRAAAILKPEYISCDGFTFSVTNLSNSPLIKSYSWDFGDASIDSDTSNIATPTFTYADTGTYLLKLVTNRNEFCSDSATALVKVYPGFFPGFTSTGICITKPTLFTDTTKTKYGLVNSWQWDFGETATLSDTSGLKNPSFIYPSIGTKNVRFIVTSSKGCIDTVYKDVTIIDKPPITLLPKDTLICVPDAVQLQAVSTGTYSWSPLINIINANTATPTVSPTATTWYYVDVDIEGCKNRGSVHVRVVDHVTLKALNDSTICLSDAMQLKTNGDGLRFQWTPAAYLNDPTLANPVATPTGTTTFRVMASIGSCSATDAVTVRTVPYPSARAGKDTIICYNTQAFLHGSYTGATFSWSRSTSLNNPLIIDPVATPKGTGQFQYILSVYDNAGCPKPGSDTVIVTVLPKVIAFAGNDTVVVVGQPLQLNATGGLYYNWHPPIGLSSNSIANPIAVYDAPADSIGYSVIVTDVAGCSATAYVNVKVFNTDPQVFVPTAFTPNADGRNDVIRPIAVGIVRIDYFRIYNRWGQLIFSTTTNGKGWDGTINGEPQGTNTYVWIVRAIDYTGKEFFKKGSVTLIR
jgi:gliding motility-associated-like protein